MTVPDAPSPLPSDAPAPPALDLTTDDDPSLFGAFLFGALTWTMRLGTIALVITGVGGLAAVGLGVTGKMPDALADSVEQRCLIGAIGSAAVTMIAAATRAAAVERYRRARREEQRLAAERAHHEAYLARIAAREAADAAAEEAAERKAAEIEAVKREMAARGAAPASGPGPG